MNQETAREILSSAQISEQLAAIQAHLIQIRGAKPIELWLPAKEAIQHPLIQGQGIRNAATLTRTAIGCGLLRLNKEYREAVAGRFDFDFEVHRTAERLAEFGKLDGQERLRKYGIHRLAVNSTIPK